MKEFGGPAFYIDRSDINTDEIIPAKYLTEISKRALQPHLLEDLILEGREFDTNAEDFQQAKVLITRSNFGCGSSREHAPWALLDFGIKVLIAPSFADIFYNNCFKNGILPITLSSEQVDQLFTEVNQTSGYELEVNLTEQTLSTPSAENIHFDVDSFRKHCLLNGLDDIGLTLEKVGQIHAYEEQRQQEVPWLFT